MESVVEFIHTHIVTIGLSVGGLILGLLTQKAADRHARPRQEALERNRRLEEPWQG